MAPIPNVTRTPDGPVPPDFFTSLLDSKAMLMSKTQPQGKNQEASIITKINGKYYDLTKFKHPGGEIPIALIADRDGTELYEAHHLFTQKRIDDILSSYEVENQKAYDIPSSGVYDWKNTKQDPFTIELHEVARKVLGKDIKANFQRWVEIVLLFIIALSQIYYFLKGEWFAIVTFPLAFWVFAVNIFHDASHFALSNNPTINKLGLNAGFLFNTPYVWYHQHVLAHHSFPNIQGKDPDLYHSGLINRHSDDISFIPEFKFQSFTFVITWIIAVPIGMLWTGVNQALTKPLYYNVVKFSNKGGKVLGTRYLRTRYAIYFFSLHILPFILHGICLKSFLFSVIPIHIFSICFMICTQINHLTPDTDEMEDRSNFFKHQILTASDVATDSYLVYLFTGGLNLQTVHHLFPSVNHCHLRKLLPYVKQVCAKHNVQYNEIPSLWQALKEHVNHLRKFDHVRT